MKHKNTIGTILLIIPSLIKGGAATVFVDQYKFFAQHGAVVACVFNWDFVNDERTKSGYVSLNVPAGKNVFQKLWFFGLRIYRLRRLKKKYCVSIAISHLEGADYVNILSARTEKVFCWIHGTKMHDGDINGFIGWIRRKILMPILYSRKKVNIVAVSESIKQELLNNIKISPTKICTIYNGFDLQDIRVKASDATFLNLKKLARKRAVLFAHCRLVRQKNIFAMLHLMDRLKDKACLFILGDGELQEELYLSGIRLGLKQYAWWRNMELTTGFDVYFLGHYDNPFSLLRQATLYIMTSSWEGFPLALCEAMACQVPVLASDCHTGPREILVPDITETQPVLHPHRSPFGILMPLAEKENYDQWNSTIRNLLEDPDLQKELAAGGEKRVADFDKKNAEKAWLKLVHE